MQPRPQQQLKRNNEVLPISSAWQIGAKLAKACHVRCSEPITMLAQYNQSASSKANLGQSWGCGFGGQFGNVEAKTEEVVCVLSSVRRSCFSQAQINDSKRKAPIPRYGSLAFPIGSKLPYPSNQTYVAPLPKLSTSSAATLKRPSDWEKTNSICKMKSKKADRARFSTAANGWSTGSVGKEQDTYIF